MILPSLRSSALFATSALNAFQSEFPLPTIPEVVAVIVAVQVVTVIANDGETNWLEGVQLLSVYLILGTLFYFLPAPPEATGH